ncbi:MAG TPA: hypothetical protein VFH44_07915 [Solirubrobacterales bacterium]|nr:hypothetical protein [Solirubrobacterales bacterium]
MPRGIVEPREGYELWHPNREKPEAKTTKAIVAFVLIISAVLLVIITLGGWTRLQSSTVGIMTLAWAALYLLFAFLVMRWNRGVLPVSAALAVIMVIFAAVAAPGWFARDKPGLESPALPEDLLGLLTVIVIPVQILLLIVAMVGFNQAWNVEEERPAGGRTTPPTPPPGGGWAVAGTGGAETEPGSEPPRRSDPTLVDDGDDWDGTRPNPAV